MIRKIFRVACLTAVLQLSTTYVSANDTVEAHALPEIKKAVVVKKKNGRKPQRNTKKLTTHTHRDIKKPTTLGHRETKKTKTNTKKPTTQKHRVTPTNQKLNKHHSCSSSSSSSSHDHNGCGCGNRGPRGPRGPQGDRGPAGPEFPLGSVLFVDGCSNQTIPNADRDGSIDLPFLTIQEAINFACRNPDFADCCEDCKTVVIMIAAGCYPTGGPCGDIVIGSGCPIRINLIALGPVSVGDFSACGCQPNTTTPAVNIRWTPAVTAEQLANGIRPVLSISSINSSVPVVDSAISASNKFRLSGSIFVDNGSQCRVGVPSDGCVISCPGYVACCPSSGMVGLPAELFIDAEIFGSVNTSGSCGPVFVTTRNANIHGGINGNSVTDLLLVVDSIISGDIIVNFIGEVSNSILASVNATINLLGCSLIDLCLDVQVLSLLNVSILADINILSTCCPITINVDLLTQALSGNILATLEASLPLDCLLINVLGLDAITAQICGIVCPLLPGVCALLPPGSPCAPATLLEKGYSSCAKKAEGEPAPAKNWFW